MKIVVFGLAAAVLALSVLVGLQLNDAGKTHDALCALRNNVNDRYLASKKILDDNPGKKFIDIDTGPGVLLISRSALVTSAHGQQQSIKSIDSSGINCH